MILLVTGGRAYANRALVFETLDAIHTETPVTVLLSGGADGADALAYQWARSRAVRVRTFVADWRNHGPAAGPMRNTEMIDVGPDLVVAFPGGRGTADCVRKARAKGVRVVEVEDSGHQRVGPSCGPQPRATLASIKAHADRCLRLAPVREPEEAGSF